jgi:hypothetical protein
MRIAGTTSSLLFGILLAAVRSGGVPAAERSSLAPVVAELFTSQGCDSCPPAEALLGELSRRPDVLPLAFHVTYWDDLGWRDTFSAPGSDARQYRYAAFQGRRSVYTPQLVINGSQQVLGSDRAKVTQAIAAAQRPARVLLGVDATGLRAEFPDIEGGCSCDVQLLSVLPVAVTAIGRGENAGRSLTQFNVVTEIRALASWNGRQVLRELPLQSGQAGAQFFVVLAQRREDARVVAVGVSGR